MSKIKVYRYPNGAKIIYVQDKDAEFTYFNCEFRVGSVDEEKGKEGAVHFLEHMAFKSTLNMSEYDRKKTLNIMCANNNAYTGHYSITYVFSALNELFEEGFKIYVDGITNCKFDKDEIGKERKVILEEYQRSLSNPSGFAGKTSYQKRYKNAEYSHDVIGTKTSIKNLSANDLKAFYQKFTPDKLTIYGGGKMSGKDYKKLMEKHLGKFLFMQDFQSVPQPKAQLIVKPSFYAFDNGNAQIQVVMYFNIFNFNDQRRPALMYINSALNGLGGRLYDEARDRQGLVYDIGTYDGLQEDGGYFSLKFGCVSENVSKVLKIFKNILRDIATNGLQDDEFAKISNGIKVNLANAKISLNRKINNAYGDMRYYGRLLTDKERCEPFEKVTNEDIKQVAQYLLDNQSYVIVGVGKGVTKAQLESYKRA